MDINQEQIKKLFSSSLVSTRSGAFYNTFPYPTKISPEAVAVYIAALTRPGDVVLDAFGGSGSTGAAALLCECPTSNMLKIAEELGVSPVWGKRNAILYEIGTYGAFASKTLLNRMKAERFEWVVKDFLGKAEKEVGKYYLVRDENGQTGTIRYVIWSEVLECPKCGGEIVYFSEGTQRNPVRFYSDVSCPHCGKRSAVEHLQYVTEEDYDGLLCKKINRKKRIPVWIYGESNGKKWDRPVLQEDLELIQQMEREPFDAGDCPRKIIWGDLHRSGYHYGITHLHHFYTRRNYTVMYKLWKLAETYERDEADALKLLLLSYNAAHGTLMTRVVAKKNAKDFVLTGAQSGVLYISKMPVEKNILTGLRRKGKVFADAYRLLESCTGQIIIHNSSSEKIEEVDQSVDFVFTDPPFGGFIPYGEVNQINELWIGKTTDRTKEIIISDAQGKGTLEYRKMLVEVFRELNRVIKNDGSIVAVFHSAKADVWQAFAEVINMAGFEVILSNILDKKQASFKQVVSKGSVQGDPVFLLHKSDCGHKWEYSSEEILNTVIEEGLEDEQVNERRIYSRYIVCCMEKGMKISFDAKDAYAYIRERVENSLSGKEKQ